MATYDELVNQWSGGKGVSALTSDQKTKLEQMNYPNATAPAAGSPNATPPQTYNMQSGQYSLNGVTPPSVLSSSMGKTIVDETKAKFDTFKTGLDNAQKLAEQIKAEQATKDQELAVINAKNAGTATMFGGGTSGTTGTVGGAGGVTGATNNSLMQGVSDRAAQAEKDLNAVLDPLKGQLETAKQSQIDGIKAKYAQLRQQLETENARRNKMQETIGVRFGGRFAIEHTADLVTAKVNEGIQRVADLNSLESQKISSVQNPFFS